MRRDFTYSIYGELLKRFMQCKYKCTSVIDYISNVDTNGKYVLIRHDVDREPNLAYNLAKIENELGIKGIYYFRIVKNSLDIEIIEKVVKLGHEIGYHYEDLSICSGDFHQAYKMFKKNLSFLRKYYPVKTICMHGSPLSKWDNRLLWSKYNYKELGINVEVYMDIDYDKILYITDTSRKWNSNKYSVRDKVETKYDYVFNSTFEIIKHLDQNRLPNQVLLNIHPNHWSNNIISWNKILLRQTIKNKIKQFYIYKFKHRFSTK